MSSRLRLLGYLVIGAFLLGLLESASLGQNSTQYEDDLGMEMFSNESSPLIDEELVKFYLIIIVSLGFEIDAVLDLLI